ncbi:MAG: hypothetical protein ACKVI9_03245 [Gammaproteobacteria bacterium]
MSEHRGSEMSLKKDILSTEKFQDLKASESVLSIRLALLAGKNET